MIIGDVEVYVECGGEVDNSLSCLLRVAGCILDLGFGVDDLGVVLPSSSSNVESFGNGDENIIERGAIMFALFLR
jgi:hypothetical protein